MTTYRKLPIEIEAFQWINQKECPAWFWEAFRDEKIVFIKTNANNFGAIASIKTLEGNMQCNPGDYIIKGVEGELYPCKREIFEKTYEIARP